MTRPVKYLMIMIGATFTGLTILIILTTVIILILNPILEIIFPSKPSSIQGDPGDLSILAIALGVTYLLSSCIASIISGYLLKGWLKGGKLYSYPWPGLTIGGIVSGGIPFLLLVFDKYALRLFLLPMPPWLDISERTMVFICSAIGALSGLLGYSIVLRK